MSTAIEFDHVSKQYRLGLVSTKTLSHDIRRFWITNILHKEDPYLKIGEVNDRSVRGSSDYVWALRDIDFKVEQGDVVGIIGKNGAGKSTLLKLLSRVTGPTIGTIRAHGRIGSLLEVGTGFHGEMTGRENIFMNGAILGMSRSEIQAKLDEIIDFSGCERYIDTPVKRYSSGMTVRLGFAVAAFLEPEILVVDEVLAVGDAEFQKKAIGKMKDVSQGEGRTVLFVSHNMESVRNLCKSGIVLKNGSIDYTGTAYDAVNYYLQSNIVECVQYVKVDGIKYCHNVTEAIKRKMEFVDFQIQNNPKEISSDEPIVFKTRIKRNNPKAREFQCAVILRDMIEKRFVTYVSPLMQVPEQEVFDVRLQLNHHHLAQGKYRVQFDLGIKDYGNVVDNYDGVSDVFLLDVNLLHRDPMVSFAGWDPQYGYMLDNESLEMSLVK